MNKNTILCVLALSVLIFTFSVSTVAAPTQMEKAGYKLESDSFVSVVLGEQRTVHVQLPKSYSLKPDQNYPVLYRLDGKENLPLINSVLERLQEANAAPEVIIVAIENTDRLRDLYPTINQEPQGPVGIGGGAAKFLTFIKTELMPRVEQKYRTHNFKMIAGGSAGGTFVLYALQTDPTLFQAHIAYSPAVWWDYGATAKTTKDFFIKTKKLNNYLYINIGKEGSFMRERYDEMFQAMSTSTPKGFTLVSDVFSDVPHGLTSVAGIFNAYHRLFLSQQMPISAYNGDTASITAYYDHLSQQYGVKTSAPELVIRELGYHFVNRGNLTEAIKLFQFGISQYPDTPDAYNGLAYGYEQNMQYKESLEQVNKALELSKAGYEGYEVYVARKARLQKLLAK
ncbi:MAG: prolyl oligopeptidase family serine peptidase [Gammaproteobacteria bacterium]|jgi:hypothetical protein|nr:prolyl oligopeptidase family serine peptidase [Gammaproteobacteria bacterium]